MTEIFLNGALGQRGMIISNLTGLKMPLMETFIFILRWWIFIKVTSAAHRGRF